jgi:hypothetical protein
MQLYRFAATCLAALVVGGCGNRGSSSSSGDPGGDGRANDASGDARVDASRGDSSPSDAPSDGPAEGASTCPDPGSGKTTYACPSGAVSVTATDDLASAVGAADAGATICIQGPHRITAPLVPRKNQTWIGVDTTAAIDGSAVLDSWNPASGMTNVWVYAGSLASEPGQPNQDYIMSSGSAGIVYACYLVSTYEDDVFYGGDRVMRVLNTTELSGSTLPHGQTITTAETGRFFFDYKGKQIYITLDPSKATVELARVPTIINGAGVEGVHMSNLLIEKALGNAIVTGSSWVLTDMTVRYAHEVGVQVGGGTPTTPTTLERVLTTSNGRYGLAGDGSWLVIKDSQISWNNISNHMRVNQSDSGACDYTPGTPGGYWGAGGAKIVMANGGSTSNPDFELIDTLSHDNVGPGFWTDVNNRYVLVQGGRFYRNEWVGYFHEIGCDIEITGVESDHNGTPIKNTGMAGYGIQISDSNNANVHDNVLHDNASGPIGLIWQQGHGGILGMAACVSPAPSTDTDTSHVLENNRFADNRAYSCAPTARTGMEYGPGDAGDLITSRKNVFDGNAYHVPDAGGTWWSDPYPAPGLTWTEWQVNGLDTSGTETSPCTYAAAPSCGD